MTIGNIPSVFVLHNITLNCSRPLVHCHLGIACVAFLQSQVLASELHDYNPKNGNHFNSPRLGNIVVL